MISPAHLSPAMVGEDPLILSGQPAFGPDGQIKGDAALFGEWRPARSTALPGFAV